MEGLSVADAITAIAMPLTLRRAARSRARSPAAARGRERRAADGSASVYMVYWRR